MSLANTSDLFTLPVLERDYKFWFYDNHDIDLFPEVSPNSTFNRLTLDNLENQTKVAVNITHKGTNNKYTKRYWALAYLTYDLVPFMVIRQNLWAEDYMSLKFIVDYPTYLLAIRYINSFKIEETVAGARAPQINEFILKHWGAIDIDIPTTNNSYSDLGDPLEAINYTINLPTVVQLD